jgi:hypothetical protein
MSEVKVNKISPRTACGTTTLGDSGDTFTIPAGVTITNSGTAAGFGATGAASWDTTVKTTGFTAVSGVGYFVNTTAGAITVTLPASPSAGDVVAVSDYANTADTNNITLGRNSSNIEGDAADFVINQEGISITLVYVDATKGWITTDTGNSSNAYVNQHIEATGGTITCSGDFRIHTFTGPGTFTVTNAGTPTGSDTVDYLVIAGGGGGAGGTTYNSGTTGGGGAGGYRESSGAASGCYTRSPLGACVSALPVSVQGYPITVGAGAAAQSCIGGPGRTVGIRGTPTVFSTIISTAGGGGQADLSPNPLGPGGSGGGGNYEVQTGGTGNTPPVSPPQGNNGGAGIPAGPPYGAGGGGGAGAVGQSYLPTTSGAGGAGLASSITGSSVTRGGGGGGGGSTVVNPGAGGIGGGGAGGSASVLAGDGIANTGGGGGAANVNPHPAPGTTTGAGGSGIVVIRYKFQ